MDDLLPSNAPTDWQQIHNRGFGTVQYAEDRNKVVFFYLRPVIDAEKSKETGRPWKKNQVFVRVAPPGERLNIVDRPATADDARRWPIQYAQFKQHNEQIPEGTSVDLLYPTSPAIAETLKGNNIYTIEQLAELSGNAIESVGMGAQAWVNAAQKYLQAAAKGVKASQLQAELDERDREIRVLKRQNEQLVERIERIEAGARNNQLAAAQALIAGQMTRPEHLPGHPFDPQVAQINATSPTSQIAKAKRRRQRPTLAG